MGSGVDNPKRRSDLAVREVEGAVVVLDRRSEKIHQLNEAAGLVWRLCDGRHSVSRIADGLAKAFSLDPELAVTDTKITVRQFEELGLFELASQV